MVTPLFGGVPATAAIARTAVNVRSGAGSRLAALPRMPRCWRRGANAGRRWRHLAARIPVAALARSTRSDAVVMVLTCAATLLFDLVIAVIAGLAVAGALALRKIAQAARVEEVPLEAGGHHAEEHALLSEHIVAYRLDGPLFFAAAHRFLLELTEVADVRVIILRMSRVTTIDGTDALVLRDAIQRLRHRGITVYLSGIRPGHHQALDALAVLDELRTEGRVFATTPEAIAAARAHLHKAGVLTTPGSAEAAPG